MKGLRNIRHLNEEAAAKISQLFKDPKVSTRVRVAALETAQSYACQEKVSKRERLTLQNERTLQNVAVFWQILKRLDEKVTDENEIDNTTQNCKGLWK